MLIRYIKVEEVDYILTITLAEREKEQGFLLHVMRVVAGGEDSGFDPELENYEIATRDQVCEGGIEQWVLSGRTLALTLTAEAADQLGVNGVQTFELDVPSTQLESLSEALQLALSPVGF